MLRDELGFHIPFVPWSAAKGMVIIMKIKAFWNYFSLVEKLIWSISVFLIVSSFLVFGQGSYLTLCASLIGVTALIFLAKGNAFGHILMIVFCLFYGTISFGFRYYG